MRKRTIQIPVLSPSGKTMHWVEVPADQPIYLSVEMTRAEVERRLGNQSGDGE